MRKFIAFLLFICLVISTSIVAFAEDFTATVTLTGTNVIQYGQSTVITATWTTNKDVTDFEWYVNGQKEEFGKLKDEQKQSGSMTYTFSSVGLDLKTPYVVKFHIYHPKQDGRDVNKTITVTVIPKELTIGGSFTAANKVYDGLKDASITKNNLSLLGVVSTNDDVTLTNVVAKFADVNAGNNKEVKVTSATLGGTKADYYTLSLTGAPISQANITKKQLTTGGSFTAANKVYDGKKDTATTTNNLSLEGVVSIDDGVTFDDVTLTNVVTEFIDVNVGDGKEVKVVSAVLGGVKADNYTLSLAGAPIAHANITKKQLTIGGTFTAANKVYDGKKDAAITTNNLSLVGIVSIDDGVTFDDVTLTNVVAEFADAKVGDGKEVKVISATLGGTKALNYTLSLEGAPKAHANIRAAVTYLGVTNIKVPASDGKAKNAGSAIPITWQFADSSGVVDSRNANVIITFALAGEPINNSHPLNLDDAAGNSGLRYDTLTKTWQFNWKTEKNMQQGEYVIFIRDGKGNAGTINVKIGK